MSFFSLVLCSDQKGFDEHLLGGEEGLGVVFPGGFHGTVKSLFPPARPHLFCSNLLPAHFSVAGATCWDWTGLHDLGGHFQPK